MLSDKDKANQNIKDLINELKIKDEQIFKLTSLAESLDLELLSKNNINNEKVNNLKK